MTKTCKVDSHFVHFAKPEDWPASVSKSRISKSQSTFISWQYVCMQSFEIFWNTGSTSFFRTRAKSSLFSGGNFFTFIFSQFVANFEKCYWENVEGKSPHQREKVKKSKNEIFIFTLFTGLIKNGFHYFSFLRFQNYSDFIIFHFYVSEIIRISLFFIFIKMTFSFSFS